MKIWFANVFAGLILVTFLSGCASSNVNPATASADTAYVDFYTPSETGLAWDVQRFDAEANQFRKVFSNLQPIPGGVLRVTLRSGGQKLRITFLNRVISEPAILELEAPAGRVTPIEVNLIATGTASVRTVGQQRGGTYRGRYGRTTKIGSDETQMYRVTAAARSPLPYQPKEQMPYHGRDAK